MSSGSLDLSPIKVAVRQAAKLCQAVQQRYLLRNEKPGQEPVTIADYASQSILCRAIQNHYPEDGIIAEESYLQFTTVLSDEQRTIVCDLISQTLDLPVTEEQIASWLQGRRDIRRSRMWVVDPLDGTRGFLVKKSYVIAVGLMQNNQPIAAVIGAPTYPRAVDGCLFVAQENRASVEALFGSSTLPTAIRVSQRTVPNTLRWVESPEEHPDAPQRLARLYRLTGISSTMVEQVDGQEKHTRVAAGDADVFVRLPRIVESRPFQIWDYVPGIALIIAAGGKVTDIDGTPIKYTTHNTLDNRGVVATNGLVHQQVISAIQSLLN